jgi:hypothetical protein
LAEIVPGILLGNEPPGGGACHFDNMEATADAE